MLLIQTLSLLAVATYATAVSRLEHGSMSDLAFIQPRDNFGSAPLITSQLSTRAERARALDGTRYSIANLTERRSSERGDAEVDKPLSYGLGGLIISGYVRQFAAPNVKNIIKACRDAKGANDATADCVEAALTAMADVAVIGITGYAAATGRIVTLITGAANILNAFNLQPAKDTANQTDIDIANGQPCINNNKYMRNFGATHTSFGSNRGVKVSCAPSCAEITNSQRGTADILYRDAFNFMINQNALEMQFALVEAPSNTVIAYCSAQLEGLPTNTCPSPLIDIGGCQYGGN